VIYTSDLTPAEAIGTNLRVALLGPPTLMWGGQPFAIARRQARALLYRIAAADNPIPREQHPDSARTAGAGSAVGGG
jgi:hypothetical protein